MDWITAIGTIFSLVAVQVLRDWRDGKHLFRKNGEAGLYQDVAHLRQHYNDELTSTLRSIDEKLELISHQLPTGFLTLENKLLEFEKYGIKGRKK